VAAAGLMSPRPKTPRRRCTWCHCSQPATATVAFTLPNLLAGSRRDYCNEHTRQVRLTKGTTVVARFGRPPASQPVLADAAPSTTATRQASHPWRKGVMP
jgi:hypothetical protein